MVGWFGCLDLPGWLYHCLVCCSGSSWFGLSWFVLPFIDRVDIYEREGTKMQGNERIFVREWKENKFAKVEEQRNYKKCNF